jgi:hypothetical protein
MSLLGTTTSKNPPNLTNIDNTNFDDVTIKDLTITEHIYFKDTSNPEVGNLVNNISVNQSTNDMTIVTPEPASLIYALGQGGPYSETLFAINPTSLNYNVGVTLKTLPYSQLDNVSGSTSNIQAQINGIVSGYAPAPAYWGTFWCIDTITTTGGGTPENAYITSYDANGNGFGPADIISVGKYASIQVDNDGFYTMCLQIRGAHTITSTEQFRGFLRLNGTEIEQTTCYNTLPAANAVFTETYNSIVINWNMKLFGGDKISPMWGAFTSNIYLKPDAASQPSVLFTIQAIAKTTQGPKGDTGDTGTNGTNGTAATIAVGTTTTLSAGASAAVTNSGTSSAAVFNFAIPQGPQGVQGNVGPTGPQGPAGLSQDLSNYATLGFATGAATAAGIAATAAADAYTNSVAAGLGTTIAAQQGEITVLQGEVTTLQGDVAVLQTDVTNLSTQVTDLATDVTDLATDVTDLQTDVTALETKTQNQSSSGIGATTFVGTVSTETVNADYIVLNQDMTGLGNINLTAIAGSNLIQAPATSINSSTGVGSVSIGGFTDTVYINGWPFASYFVQF